MIGIGLATGQPECCRCQSNEISDVHLYQVEVADALVVDDATDGLGKHVGYGELLHLGATLRVGDGVSENNLFEGGSLYAVAGRTAHDAVAGAGTNRLGTRLLHQVGGLGDGSCRVDHVVDNDHVLAFDVADDLHRSHHVGTGTGLVAEHQW